MNLATLQSQFAKALYYQASGEECGITGDLFSADERIQIYRNNFIISLSEVLSTTYPMLEALLGKECFAQIARQHVLTHPLEEGQVAYYGEGFYDTIRLFENVTSQVPYSMEVARFEWAMDLARQAQRERLPTAELTPLNRLAEVNTDQQPLLIFHLHNGVRSFESRYAVFDLFAAIQSQHFEALDINLSQCGAISLKRSGDVLCHALEMEAYQLLDCLEKKLSLGDIAQPLLPYLNTLMLLDLIEGFTLQQR
ncbi:DNA-binding domain-containing protein [Vibrio sp. EA2]|uniref:HvfC/BufC N-terminal domain-containing protein n=1 Tax=Vibrio sp. EA2 TaxID=3079860 RepID=UPI002949644C|nr:DNA-binding domain-containing protein [Vibrio sp. EA2]MDV6254196.1 DNA-binding domain-containing protein [Vibrio sp. EA2]